MAAVALAAPMVTGTAAPAAAQTAPTAPPAGLPVIDPMIARALGFGPRPMAPPPGQIDVVITLRDAGDLLRLGALRGVTLAAGDHGPVRYGLRTVARIDEAGLSSLRTATFVARVSMAPPAGRPPLERSAERLHLSAVHAGTIDGSHGRGVLIGDLDSPMDVYHPAFFFADGGAFAWIDTNGSGRLDVGDHVDLDGDGAGDPGEEATFLLATPIDFYGATPTQIRERPGFDPAVDWVYLDQNGDGIRNVGSDSGFDDTAPALGEAIFVPDDVDRDHVLDLDERLFRLGTPKVRAMRVDDRGFSARVYERGESLSTTPRVYTEGAYGYADTLHGTGVAGILIGDVPLIGRRWVGIVPEAELVLGSDLDGTNIDGLMWALGRGANVMLHEYVLWTSVALDGSDATSALIDESTATGVAHACPAGNIGGAAHHAMAMLPGGGVASLPVDISTAYFDLMVQVPVTASATVTLIEPGGARHVVSDATGETLSNGVPLYYYGIPSDRTHAGIGVLAYAPGDAPPPGQYVLEVAGTAGDPAVTIHAFSSDEAGFARGAAFVDATDASTIAWPATADRCVAVGAYPDHLDDDGRWFPGGEREGEVRGYSARGPRIDGAQSIDVIAPDNPITPLGEGDAYPASPGSLIAPEGAFQIFGGTSGAGPHVAGVLALLHERGMGGAAATQRLIDSAVADAIAGAVPNDDYGHGRIDAAAALELSADGSAPVLSLDVTIEGDVIRITPMVSDPDGTTPQVRWDVGYDGVFDGALEAAASRTFTAPVWVKVEARDETGRRDQRVVRIDSLATFDAGVSDAGPGGGGGGGCGCRVGGPARATSGLSITLLSLALALARVAARRRAA